MTCRYQVFNSIRLFANNFYGNDVVELFIVLVGGTVVTGIYKTVELVVFQVCCVAVVEKAVMFNACCVVTSGDVVVLQPELKNVCSDVVTGKLVVELFVGCCGDVVCASVVYNVVLLDVEYCDVDDSVVELFVRLEIVVCVVSTGGNVLIFATDVVFIYDTGSVVVVVVSRYVLELDCWDDDVGFVVVLLIIGVDVPSNVAVIGTEVVDVAVVFTVDICVLVKVVDVELQLNVVCCVVVCGGVVELSVMLYVEQFTGVVGDDSVEVFTVFSGVLETFVKLNVVDCCVVFGNSVVFGAAVIVVSC